MLPPLRERRKPSNLSIATVAALVLQFAALVWALWHGHRELASLETRDAAIERIVEHVDFEVTPTPAVAPAPRGKP